MYCPECGTLNNDDAVYCEACGTKIREETTMQMNIQPTVPMQTVVAKKPVQISKTTILLIAEIILLLGIGYGMFKIGEQGCSAERVATNYFINVANSDWEEAYEKLDVEDTEFINAKMFAAANSNKVFGVINNYQVRKVDDNSLENLLLQQSSLGTTVDIDYRIKGSTENSVYTVNLNKQADKKYLFFDSWKVGTSNLICTGYNIYVPQGASVVLDGITLSDQYITNDEDILYYVGEGMVCYVIPEIFYGTHSISVSMEDKKTITDTIEIGYDNYSYYVENMEWEEEVIQNLIKLAGENMQQIYTAAMNGKNFNTIGNLFTTQEEARREIEDAYNNLLYNLNETDYIPTKISFSDIKGEAYSEETAVTLSFAYNVEYTYEDWWTGDLKNSQYNGTDEWYFVFEKENGNWVLTNLGCKGLYY